MENNKVHDIGKRIAKLRKEKGYSQRELGDLIYVSDKTISKWERGVSAPDLTILENLSSQLGVGVEELISGEKVSDANNATIDGINIYVNQTKKRYLSVFLVIFFAIVFVFLTIFLVSKYYRWTVTYLESNGDFNVYGYAFYNSKEAKIIFDKISYDTDVIGTVDEPSTNYLKVSIFLGEEEIYSKTSYYEKITYFHECFENYSLVFESEEKISETDLNNLFLRIEYTDNFGNIKNIDILF